SSPLVGLLVAVALVVASTVGALALASRTPAAAVGLVRFESCEALEAWAVDAVGRPTGGGRDDAGDVAVEDASPDAAPPAPGRAESALGEAAADGQTAGSGTGAGSGDADTGGTNTVVEGVDEVDLVDRIDERRVLVAADGTLSLVDLAARRRLAS